MSRNEKLQCLLLLALVTIPVSIPKLQATSFGGWPALGFAAALFIVVGRGLRWWAVGLQLAIMSVALSFSYDVALPLGAVGGLSVILPALLTAHLLRAEGGRLRLDEVDNVRYHTVTALSLLCGLGAAGAVAVGLAPKDAPIAGLMSFLAALTAQLVVLPLVVRTSDRRAAAGRLELPFQRLMMVAVTLAVFWPNTRLTIAFVTFPLLSWAAIRATRREAHIQLFLVCADGLRLTFAGHGPLAGNMRGVPDDLHAGAALPVRRGGRLPHRAAHPDRRAARHHDRSGHADRRPRSSDCSTPPAAPSSSPPTASVGSRTTTPAPSSSSATHPRR